MKANFNKLEEIDKSKNPFKVPDNYFANFNEEIMDLLPEKEFEPPVKMTLWDRAKPWVYMAAMFIGLYFMINILTNNESSATQETVVAEQTTQYAVNSGDYWSTVHVTEEEFYEYLEDQLIDDGFYDYMYENYYYN